MAPEYLCELVSIRKSSQKLRSSSQILLQVSRLKSYGDCAFSVAAPTLWNRLSADIRNASSLENFKSLFKNTCLRSLSQMNNYYLLNHYRVLTDILFGILLYYILFVQCLWMAPASKGALLNVHYYYYDTDIMSSEAENFLYRIVIQWLCVGFRAANSLNGPIQLEINLYVLKLMRIDQRVTWKATLNISVICWMSYCLDWNIKKMSAALKVTTKCRNRDDNDKWPWFSSYNLHCIIIYI